MSLAGYQKRFLRGQANTLKPAVIIGRNGLTPAVLQVIDENLTAHELIKVRFGDFKSEKKELSARIAEETGAELAGIIGHVAILYRQHPEKDRRTIRLPKRTPAPPSNPEPGGANRVESGVEPEAAAEPGFDSESDSRPELESDSDS